MMGCSADGGTEANIKMNGEDCGIMSGHAYAVIDVFEIPDEDCKNYHKSHRLLKIRNPWGYGEWKLKWSEEEIYRAKFDKFID
jgi:calpain